MRISGISIFMIAAITMLGCQFQIPESQTVVRHGMVYEKGDDDPFTGVVVGRARDGYRAQVLSYSKQYKDGLLDGTSKYWYPNGKLESVEPYTKGKINGWVIRYYDNGQMKARIPMKDGMRSGVAGELFWDRNGKLIKG